MITQISESLFLSDAASARSAAVVEHGIGAILCLDRHTWRVNKSQYMAPAYAFPIDEQRCSDFSFLRAVYKLRRLCQSHARVLVHCRFGQSRSVAVIAAYLVVAEQIDPSEALRLVMTRRDSPGVTPHLQKFGFQTTIRCSKGFPLLEDDYAE